MGKRLKVNLPFFSSKVHNASHFKFCIISEEQMKERFPTVPFIKTEQIVPCARLETEERLMKGDGVRDSGTGVKTGWFGICVCVRGNGAERRAFGLYLYSSGPGYPWIHLGDWEACRRRKWESSYFSNVPLIPTMIKKSHTV